MVVVVAAATGATAPTAPTRQRKTWMTRSRSVRKQPKPGEGPEGVLEDPEGEKRDIKTVVAIDITDFFPSSPSSSSQQPLHPSQPSAFQLFTASSIFRSSQATKNRQYAFLRRFPPPRARRRQPHHPGGRLRWLGGCSGPEGHPGRQRHLLRQRLPPGHRLDQHLARQDCELAPSSSSLQKLTLEQQKRSSPSASTSSRPTSDPASAPLRRARTASST